MNVNITGYISILVQEDLLFRIIQSGFSKPIMYHVIEESPYNSQGKFYFLNIEEVSKLIGLTSNSILLYFEDIKHLTLL